MEMATPADPLRAFLDRPERPPEAIPFDQLHGFLFAVANAPELISPSAWMSVVLGEDTVFEDEQQAEAISAELLEEYNAIDDFCLSSAEIDGTLPPGCKLLNDPDENLADDAPIAEWCRGFVKGHVWVSDLWSEYLPADLSGEDKETVEMAELLGTAFVGLGYFTSREVAETILQEHGGGELTLSELTSTIHENFPEAIRTYVAIGRSLQAAAEIVDQEPVRRVAPKVGRNDPCPCGSGRKFKKCCGATT
jgi:uncharacterized protein